MSAACIGEPVSWLRLERYRLGELDPAERHRVGEHLEVCPACRACLQQIDGDRRELRPLPLPFPLPARPALAGGSAAVGPRAAWPRRLAWGAGAATLAAAAALALVLALPPHEGALIARAVPPARRAVKGGELALLLLRERQGQVVEGAARYLDGDRFRVLATCPPAEAQPWQLVVFQGGEAFLPLPGGERLRCGNAVPLPGAFRLTGSASVTVCLVLGPPLPATAQLARLGPGGLPAGATVCTELASGGR